MHCKIASVLLLLFIAAGGSALADTTRIPAPATTEIALPERGMTMTSVETLFGAPLEKLPPVGEPPITRWVYKDYIVFFEYDRVLHSVLTGSD